MRGWTAPAEESNEMDYGLTEEQTMIKDLCAQIGEEKIKPVREHYDESGEFPWDLVKVFAEADLFGIQIEEQYAEAQFLVEAPVQFFFQPPRQKTAIIQSGQSVRYRKLLQFRRPFHRPRMLDHEGCKIDE